MKHILVIANETAQTGALQDAIRRRAGDPGEARIAVVAPALNSRVRHWLSDEDDARRAPELRLAECVERLARAGLEADGRVGDADPLQAIADALVEERADLIIVST